MSSALLAYERNCVVLWQWSSYRDSRDGQRHNRRRPTTWRAPGERKANGRFMRLSTKSSTTIWQRVWRPAAGSLISARAAGRFPPAGRACKFAGALSGPFLPSACESGGSLGCEGVVAGHAVAAPCCCCSGPAVTAGATWAAALRHRNGHAGYGVDGSGSGFALFTRLGRLQDSSCVRLAVGHLILAAARRTSGYRDLTTSIGGQRLRLQYGVRRLRGPGLSGPVFQTLAESRFSPN